MFSLALWVMWGLLCGHLVAFKAPKSWPNKFLINVWGGFSVIFVASYTANIAALIAGLFFQNAASKYEASVRMKYSPVAVVVGVECASLYWARVNVVIGFPLPTAVHPTSRHSEGIRGRDVLAKKRPAPLGAHEEI